ncbi:MAG: GNAT family N-acetyltransferase [candidate division Zixibacteria bacterium]|nr:GNAT family N-acetyltransferase [candidate division Zixibacteria bacterium]
MNNSDLSNKTSSKLKIHELRRFEDFPSWIRPEQLAVFLRESLKPYDDPLPDVKQGITDALLPRNGEPGFVLIAEIDQQPVAALIMLRTGMKGYVPENLLLWVAVDQSVRGKGVGSQIIRRSFELADGDVKLHVEYDNPAKRLYERLGMTSEYAEMRYHK